jgi:hypothetical protein
VLAQVTKDGQRCLVPWQTWVVEWRDAEGIIRQETAYRYKAASEQLKARKEREAARQQEGMVDAYAEQLRRPLAEHLADYRRELEARDNKPSYVALVITRLTALLDGCGLRFIADLSASLVNDWLADLRRKGRERLPLEEGKQKYTMREAAAILGIKPGSLAIAVKRYRLQATGQGRAVAPRDGRSAAKPPLPRDQHADEQLLPVQCQVLLPLAGEGPARAR